MPLVLLVFVRLLTNGDAGIVDQDIEPPETRDRVVHQRLAVSFFGYIGGNERAAEFGGCLRALGLVASGQDHPRASTGETLGHTESDPAITAGHDSDLTGKIEQVHGRGSLRFSRIMRVSGSVASVHMRQRRAHRGTGKLQQPCQRVTVIEDQV